MSRDSQDVVPAIVRDMTDADRDATVISTPTDKVSFSRGWGDSGYRVEVVEHECPRCDFDRMVRRTDVGPEYPTSVRYWCLNPNCAHYASDHLSHACHGNYPQMSVSEPEVYEASE